MPADRQNASDVQTMSDLFIFVFYRRSKHELNCDRLLERPRFYKQSPTQLRHQMRSGNLLAYLNQPFFKNDLETFPQCHFAQIQSRNLIVQKLRRTDERRDPLEMRIRFL